MCFEIGKKCFPFGDTPNQPQSDLYVKGLEGIKSMHVSIAFKIPIIIRKYFLYAP